MFAKRIFCFLFGHRYHVLQKFNFGARRVICLHCNGDWGMHDETKSFIRWDDELEQMYKSFGHRIIKP